MCGIFGILGPTPERFHPDAALAALRHRGPDSQAYERYPHAILGNTRLSILDPTPAGRQPMTIPEAGICLVHNGEVYNYVELREEIGGEFRSHTDTEVVLRLFADRGVEALPRLNGMFAFAVWNEPQQTLVVVRDRLGIKPLYFCRHDGHLLFASEIKALLAMGVPAVVNQGVVWDYLARGLYDHSDETFFAGIHQLPAGHYLTCTSGGTPRITRYWHLPDHVRESEGDGAQAFSDTLEQVVEWECRSDVPVGILFSGGLDSSALLALMREKRPDAIRAFSYVFDDYGYNQLPYMTPVAQHYGIEHIVSQTSAREFWDDFPRTLASQDEPTGSITITAFKKVFESVHATDVVVVLSGNGMDELLGGYKSHRRAHLADLRASGAADYASELTDYARAENQTTAAVDAEMAAYDLSAEFMRMPVDGTSGIRRACLSPAFLEWAFREPLVRTPFSSNLKNRMYADLAYLKIPRSLRFQDRMSMRHSKELRPPFLNHLLVECCFGFDNRELVRAGRGKHLLRSVMADRLPQGFSEQPKRLVTHPQREWLRHDLVPQIRDLIASRSFRERPWFDARQVDLAFDAWVAGEGNNSFFIWQWLNLEIWMQLFIDSRVQVSA